MVRMENKFKEIINEEMNKEYFKEIREYLDIAYRERIVYPPQELLFNAFELCNYDDLKVVILGQDPYHQAGQAMGLAFSVPCGVKIPPSLVNIYKELNSDMHIDIPESGDLSKWAKQGVLMLNTVLSVEDSKPNVHRGIGWLTFTKNIMKRLNEYDKPLVFILWGKPAQNLGKLITNPRHHKIESVHPSPLSSYRGFFGSKPFSRTNEFLKNDQREEIDWSLK